jgi:hypothetical protein
VSTKLPDHLRARVEEMLSAIDSDDKGVTLDVAVRREGKRFISRLAGHEVRQLLEYAMDRPRRP